MSEADGLIRASDAEREHAAARLHGHMASGRLSVEELASRLEAAFSAETRGELAVLFGDLPTGETPEPTASRRPGAAINVRAYVVVCLGLIAIWAASGMCYFWPVWPILGWGIGLISQRARVGGVVPRSRPGRLSGPVVERPLQRRRAAQHA